MKSIRALAGPTPGLEDYLRCDGANANWAGFRSHRAGAAYKELADALRDIQRGLCGYCEIDLIEADRQVEHVVPQSDPQQGAARALDSANLMACCKGGTSSIGDDARRFAPVRRNRSCGEAKGNKTIPGFVDPRALPPLPSVTRVGYDGRIEADNDACIAAGVAPGRVAGTIEALGLNGERLRLAREKHWRALEENWRDHLGDPELLEAAARMELMPDENGKLPRFFTASRSYFAPLGENILSEDPPAWL